MCSKTLSFTGSERVKPNDFVDPRPFSGWLSGGYVCVYANGLISQIILCSQSFNLQSVAFEQHFEHANMATLCDVLNQM